MGIAEYHVAGDVVEMSEPVMGGEDVAFFLEARPGAFFFLNTCDPEKN